MLADARQPDVSVVITFHRERLLAHKSLLSLSRCRAAAERDGINVQVIATLDRPDAETARVVAAYNLPGKPDRVLSLDVGDLGESRNQAIRQATGQWILICDGDDYLSENFITRCLQLAREHGSKVILHPELVVMFDGWNALSWQSGDDDPAFDAACMLVCNPWNSCSFAQRSIYLAAPYVLARPGESGFGFEDWHWNCETLALGYAHRIASGTVHYVRRKLRDSLNAAHAGHYALIARTRLFDTRR